MTLSISPRTYDFMILLINSEVPPNCWHFPPFEKALILFCHFIQGSNHFYLLPEFHSFKLSAEATLIEYILRPFEKRNQFDTLINFLKNLPVRHYYMGLGEIAAEL